MSVVLDDALSQYLHRTAPLADAAPFTITAWFKSDDATAHQVIWAEVDVSHSSKYWSLRASGDAAGDPVGVYISNATSPVLETSSGYSTGTWTHAAFVEAGIQDHSV